ncbi:hypothetical protein G7Z17_g3279 [Cylindrodendrum hubeiense]|uniref:Alcohol dehydrogenase iron-type/glycerol dehydrogenase GldA domain-containing protein n=1 Tax=Cylindrodendrum hubeiense TaxID=595255 RepID=A0A9P5LK54_9HYPO|nr:hypothetical protein G7Z17_g3279 [Cylindrodendrum hubeiense]
MIPESTDLRHANTDTASGTKLPTNFAKHPRALSRSSISPPSISGARKSSSHAAVRASSTRIVLGPGVLDRLPTELGRLGLSAPLIVSSPSRADLTARIHAIIPGLDRHVLDPSIIEQFPARNIDDDAVAGISGRDCVVSVGGGSAVELARIIGLGKAIPHICIPTTYSGSEFMMPPHSPSAKTRDRRRRGKRTSKSPKASSSKPVVIIYDEDLTISTTKMIFTPDGINTNGNAHSGESRHRTKDDTLWSYIHLPGV